MGTGLTERARYWIAFAAGSVFLIALTGGSIFLLVRVLGVQFLSTPVLAGVVTGIHLGIPAMIFVLVFGMGLIHRWYGNDFTAKRMKKEITAFKKKYGIQFTPTRPIMRNYIFVFLVILGVYVLLLCNIAVYSIDFHSTWGRVLSIGAAWLMIPAWVIVSMIVWTRMKVKKIENKAGDFIEYINAHTPQTNLRFERDIGMKKIGFEPVIGSRFSLSGQFRGNDIRYEIESTHKARVPVSYYSSPGRRFNLEASYVTTVGVKGLAEIEAFSVFIIKKGGKKALDFEEGGVPGHIEKALLGLPQYCYIEAIGDTVTLYNASKEFPAYSLEGVILLLENLTGVAGLLKKAG
jgi:hypothetical protein